MKNYESELEIEHYSCLIDAHSCAVRIQETEKVVLSVPFEVSATVYRIFPNACRVQGDKEAGKRVAEKPFSLEPSNAAPSVLLNRCNQMHSRTYNNSQLQH